jgi:hypothetical protein
MGINGMVAKCANPECSSQFRYFHSGKLFVVESNGHKLSYDWLCEKCCRTLVVERQNGNMILKARIANEARTA